MCWLNFHSLEVVDRVSETQLREGKTTKSKGLASLFPASRVSD